MKSTLHNLFKMLVYILFFSFEVSTFEFDFDLGDNRLTWHKIFHHESSEFGHANKSRENGARDLVERERGKLVCWLWSLTNTLVTGSGFASIIVLQS